jgi:hypothetical protein
MTPPRAIPFVVPLLVALLAGGACGDDDARNAPNAAPSTTAAAAGSTPTELHTGWQTTLDNGESVTLRLRADSYQITRGPASGSGRVDVEGDIMTFSNSNLCDGIGTYRWLLQNDILTLTSTRADPCSGRSEVLAGQTFVRAG